MEFKHTSVLLEETIEGLNIRPDGIYIDGTLGGGGHTFEICKRLTSGRVIGIDQDEAAIQAAGERLKAFEDKVTIVRSNYSDLKSILEQQHIQKADGIILDLGVSSYQLDNAERGFSYQSDSLLDMRMDRRQTLTAREIVNGYSEEKYGPENNITRIEFICMLSRLLKYYDTQCIEKGLVYYYQDYDTNHYSKKDYDYLMRCYAILEDMPDISSLGFNEITDVFGTGQFNMNKPITRAEVVAMMDPFIDDLDTSGCELTDINSSKFRSSILKAYASGLINGYPDGTFKPNNPITRAEMAVILGRYISGNIYIL